MLRNWNNPSNFCWEDVLQLFRTRNGTSRMKHVVDQAVGFKHPVVCFFVFSPSEAMGCAPNALSKCLAWFPASCHSSSSPSCSCSCFGCCCCHVAAVAMLSLPFFPLESCSLLIALQYKYSKHKEREVLYWVLVVGHFVQHSWMDMLKSLCSTISSVQFSLPDCLVYASRRNLQASGRGIKLHFHLWAARKIKKVQ